MADPAQPSRPSSRPSRKFRIKRVIYKSTSLQQTAPSLNNTITPDAVSQSRAIQNANVVAERVRDDFHTTKSADSHPGLLVDDPATEPINGTDDKSNAKKYERRLKMNRKSAAASRLRREAYTKALEVEVIGLEAALKEITDRLEKEEAIKRRLENQNTDLPQSLPSQHQPHSPPQQHLPTDFDNQNHTQFDPPQLSAPASPPPPRLDDPPARFFAQHPTNPPQQHFALEKPLKPPQQHSQQSYLPKFDASTVPEPIPPPQDSIVDEAPANGYAEPLFSRHETKPPEYLEKTEDSIDYDDLITDKSLVEDEYRKLLAVSDDQVDAEFFLAFSPEDGYPAPSSSRL